MPLGLVAYILFARSGPDYAVLYSNLNPEDAGEIVAELGRQGVSYRLRAGGTIVEVPENRVHELRIGTAAAGLPARRRRRI